MLACHEDHHLASSSGCWNQRVQDPGSGPHDVVELNPAHVKAVRAQQGARRLKTDLRDAAAIVDLLISGGGRAPQQRDAALVEQLVWAGVRLQTAKAQQLHQAAADALRLPAAERACRAQVLAADLTVLDLLTSQITQAEQHLAQVLPDTPDGVLTSLPGTGVVRTSNYGAALGDPARFGNADQAYRAPGLVPASYESAGRARRGQGISREGNAQLCEAIIELGRGLAQRDSDFARYRASLSNRMKPLQAAIAVGHRPIGSRSR